MSGHRGKKLGEIFVALGVLDAEQQKAALEYSKRWSIPFGTACVKMGFTDDATVVQALAAQMGAPSVSLAGVTPAPAVLAKITAEQAEKYRAMPVTIVPGPGKGTLVIAITSPRNLHALDEIAFVTGHRVSAVLASDADLNAALLRCYGLDVDRHTRGSAMVDLELEAFQQSGDGKVELVHDPLRLALDFLPVVTPR